FQSDVLYRGVPDEGYTFRKDANGGLGGLYMQSPFNPLGREAYAPADANVAATSLEASWAWLNARTLVAAQGYPQVLAVSSPGPGDVATTLRVVDIATETLVEVDPSYVMDIDPLIPTIRNTAEVGFKGFLSQTLGASVDVYHNRVNNFVSAVRVETPNVFLDSTSVHAYLLSEGVPEADVAELASKLAEIPLGTITPEGFTGDDAADLMISYRNFGDFSYMGVDMSLLWAPSRLWTGGLNYSYVSRDFFRSADGIGDVALNAPKHKFGGMVAYSDRATGFNAMLRVRYVDAFPVDSGAYTGTIQAYTIADLSASYDFTEATRLNLTIQNILDHRHQEFIGAPELGRLALLGLSQSF
ncbi:MAG: TonB-dependent receptor, partial [Gemmatimonadota bacterium]|nr:TonB-dependent receptor [Gemmatimonadota bacterium]